MSEDWRTDRVGAALRGENPTVITRLAASFAVLGDVQFLPGYCIALTDRPGVRTLTDLPRPDRLRFLDDMESLGEAVEKVCRARDPGFRRVNLEILGNTDAILHAHIWPRYDWEPPELVTMPVWLYPKDRWSDPSWRVGAEHDPLKREIARVLDDIRRPD